MGAGVGGHIGIFLSCGGGKGLFQQKEGLIGVSGGSDNGRGGRMGRIEGRGGLGKITPAGSSNPSF